MSNAINVEQDTRNDVFFDVKTSVFWKLTVVLEKLSLLGVDMCDWNITFIFDKYIISSLYLYKFYISAMLNVIYITSFP